MISLKPYALHFVPLVLQPAQVQACAVSAAAECRSGASLCTRKESGLCKETALTRFVTFAVRNGTGIAHVNRSCGRTQCPAYELTKIGEASKMGCRSVCENLHCSAIDAQFLPETPIATPECFVTDAFCERHSDKSHHRHASQH
jgi:hypothetical protein